MIEKPEMDKLVDYIRLRGKAGERTIKILGKNYQFIAAFNTEIGKELLADMITLHKDVSETIIIKGETPELRAEINVLNRLIIKWSDKINAYYGAVKTINESK